MSAANPFFTAVYLNSQGEKISRDFFDMRENAIGRHILAEGGTILSIRPNHVKWWMKEHYSTVYKVNFLDAIVRRTNSGWSPSQALELVIDNEQNRQKRREMEGALVTLNNGRDFSDALEKLGFFDVSVIALLRSGERSGMRDALEAAKSYLSKRKAMLRQFGLAIFWVGLEFSQALMIPFLVQWEALPWIESHAAKSSKPEDAANFAADMQLAYILNGAWMWFTVALVVGGVFAFIGYKRNEAIRRKIDEIIVKIPVINRFIVDAAMADSLTIGANMVKAHVPFFEAVETLREISFTGLVKDYWDDVARSLERSGDPSEAMIEGGLLRKDEIQLLEHQHGSSQLGEALVAMAEDRALSASRGRSLMIWLGMVIMIIYAAVSLGVVGWVYLIYDSSINASMMDFAGGGF